MGLNICVFNLAKSRAVLRPLGSTLGKNLTFELLDNNIIWQTFKIVFFDYYPLMKLVIFLSKSQLV
jgi:hypothetical protein